MKKGAPNTIGGKIRGVLRQALSPTFIIILLGAALLWYTTKLGYEYTTEIPLNVRIDGQKYRLTAVVSGRGSTIVAQQLSLKGSLNFTLDEFSSRPSLENPRALTITPASLQRAINGKITDLVIVQVIDAPEFVPAPDKDEGNEAGIDGGGAGTGTETQEAGTGGGAG